MTASVNHVVEVLPARIADESQLERAPAGDVLVISLCAGQGRDGPVVHLTSRGDAQFISVDGTRARHPGDSVVCETDKPFARKFGRGLEELIVTVPRSVLSAPPGRNAHYSARTQGA